MVAYAMMVMLPDGGLPYSLCHPCQLAPHLSQVNEISWNKENDQFFLTNGNGCVVIFRYACNAPFLMGTYEAFVMLIFNLIYEALMWMFYMTVILFSLASLSSLFVTVLINLLPDLMCLLLLYNSHTHTRSPTHLCSPPLSWPDMKQLHTINAHPANCICIEFSPDGKYVSLAQCRYIGSSVCVLSDF